MMKRAIILLWILISVACSKKPEDPVITDTNLYFPEADNWETISPANLEWDIAEINNLENYLQEKNTKAFIILKNGRIALETYYDSFDQNSIWYWASAGKTLTTTLTAIAQEDGLFTIEDPVTTYLGNGWTSAPAEKENLINMRHLLSMTSGLDDSQGDNIDSENLKYISDAGTRWAYHNVYVKLQDAIALTSGKTWESYFNEKLRDPIGMNGQWRTTNDFSVYWSNARSMARFGLLIAAEGKWKDRQIVSSAFISESTSSSQNINLSYGYLWWLNGKTSYHLPQSQYEFTGSLIPDAPDDMFCALGKNDQKIYIVPSKALVIIRMGQAADQVNFSLSDFDNELWKKINAVIE